VELASVASFREMIVDGTINSGSAIASGYRALEHLGAL